MCGISGFSNFKNDYTTYPDKWNSILNNMNKVQKRRGPDDDGTYLDPYCGLAHVRLSIIDLTTGHQPMIKSDGNDTYCIVHNGEIYNMHSLKNELTAKGAVFETTSDTEVILTGYMMYGTDFVKSLVGIFAFTIWDSRIKKLFLFRDHLGVKPLFYTLQNDGIIFSSELKGLFQYPGIEPIIDKDGICEIFGLGPAKTYGKGVFKDVMEVLPGNYLEFSDSGLKQVQYWQLKSKPHTDSFKETVDKTSHLVHQAVKSQMISDVQISTLLSGGVDSSLVTAICAEELKKDGKVLNTYSFDFKDNNIHFKSNAFQPSEDRPWVEKMVDFSKTNHTFLECDNKELIDYLYKAVDARDLPCMADVESSMLYFCSIVAQHNKVTLTGECADESEHTR